MKIVLGSGSARRRKILKDMGFDFEVITADIDEKSIRCRDPKELTLTLARAKAVALTPSIDSDSILITSDLVVVFDGEILEKPESKEEAYRIALGFRDKPVQTVAAVVVTNIKTGKIVEGVDVVTIYFKPFRKEDIEQFVESGKVFEHAGSFAAEQEPFSKFIDRLEGTIESVAGLPVDLTKKLIEEAVG
ncbi:MAG: septum formation protein Maf [Candidatus Doudnabacteria bacterium]|nr:septum formation protein Maf [Candidatus Doudnabacteria bacterium]